MSRRDSQIEADLHQEGRRVTTQRRLILEVVRATRTHPTAGSVYRRMRRRLPRISLGTVYRNLELFVEQGLLQELDSPEGNRYDGNAARHDHFICQVCGRISDVLAPANRALYRRVAARTGAEISRHRTEFYGRCAACRARERRRARARERR